jgi:hypothetical protein
VLLLSPLLEGAAELDLHALRRRPGHAHRSHGRDAVDRMRFDENYYGERVL